MVNWKPTIAEEMDIEKKLYDESHQPHTVSDKAVRRQLRRIAKSLVTAAITSAVAKTLVQQGRIATSQVSQLCIYNYHTVRIANSRVTQVCM